MKDKIIEEMARDMDYGCIKRDLYPDDAKEIAKALYLLGYRKIPEGAVVLTREEYEQIQDRVELLKENEDIGNALFRSNELCRKLVGDKKKLKQELKHAHKETAETFAERLKARYMPPLAEWDEISIGSLFYEIDEICKEFTGRSD